MPQCVKCLGYKDTSEFPPISGYCATHRVCHQCYPTLRNSRCPVCRRKHAQILVHVETSEQKKLKSIDMSPHDRIRKIRKSIEVRGKRERQMSHETGGTNDLSQFQLVWNGITLEDNQTCKEVGLSHECTVQVKYGSEPTDDQQTTNPGMVCNNKAAKNAPTPVASGPEFGQTPASMTPFVRNSLYEKWL